jgi:hypothetical protein
MDILKASAVPVLFAAIIFAMSCSGQKQAAEETVIETTETVTETITTTVSALTASGPVRNPYLAADKYAITHFDPAQTDTMTYPAVRGTYNIDLNTMPRIVSGPINLMTYASTSPDYMWSISSEGMTYIDISNGGFREAARLAAPGVKVISPETHAKVLGQTFTSIQQVEKAATQDYGLDWTRIANGVYSLVDSDNVVYANYNVGSIFAFGLSDPSNPSAGIKVLRSLDVSNLLSRGERIAGLSMTYDGKLIILGNRSMRVVDRSLAGEPVTITFGEDEYISNSMAVDEKGGIYVASDTTMYKIVWTGTRLSQDEADGAWSAPYDSGQQPPSVKFGKGTGSTPTLVGFGNDPDKLVVITDGSDHMKLVAFWRDDIPAGFQQVPGAKSNRIAGQIQVTCGLPQDVKFIQSEQSVVANGYGAFVVNNIRDQGSEDRLVDVLAGGSVFTPATGAERFEWNPDTNTWSSVWTRSDVVSTSMVPALSAPSGIVFVNGYTKQDGWEITGMDWATGETVHRTIFGQSNLGNGAYAIIQLFPNSDMLFNGIGGPARIHY